MKKFGYALDPLCAFSCTLYAVNRFWLKGHFGGPFLRGQFNDLLLIPAALPFVLWLQRRLRLRTDDHRPRWSEISLHVLVWSITAEWIAPHIFARTTGDWRDVIAYTVGGAVAGCWWQGLPWS